RLLVLEAVKHRGDSLEEALAAVEALRPRVELYAMIDTLEYLAKGGRLKASTAFLGNLLGIKPVITLSREGKVEVLSKERSVRHAFRKIRQLVRPEEIDWDYPVYYMYTQNRSGSELLCEALTPERKDLLSSALNICPAIGTHIGPNAAGITFVRKQ
ncbi:MAG: DegV family protein, partial [Christensenellaceae bacterium]